MCPHSPNQRQICQKTKEKHVWNGRTQVITGFGSARRMVGGGNEGIESEAVTPDRCRGVAGLYLRDPH